MGITVRVDNRVLATLPGVIVKNAADAVRQTAMDGRQLVSALSPVRTGALRASWYVSGPNGESTYPADSGTARELNPLAVILDEATPELAEPDLPQPCAILSSAVNYSIFIEEGTRYMAPRPVLRPASEVMRNELISLLSGVAG